MRWNSWKVDWPNHLIGFFSALFGILIAFELDQWRETKNNEEDARNAFDKIRQEIQVNKSALHETVSTNLKLIDLLEEEVLSHVNDRLEYHGHIDQANAINVKVKPIAKIILTDTVVASTKAPVLINMGSLLHPTLHNSAWESAKATGVINYIEYEKVLSISYLYNIPRITDELQAIRALLRKSDEITTKSSLKILLKELRESHLLIQSEMANYDVFVNIIEGMG
jgi:hypothetical protein